MIVDAFRSVSDRPDNELSIAIEELPASVDLIKAAIRESIRARFLEQNLTADAREMFRSCYVRLAVVVTREEREEIGFFVASQLHMQGPHAKLGRVLAQREPLPPDRLASYRRILALEGLPPKRLETPDDVLQLRLIQFVRMAEAEAEIDEFLGQFPV
jgi:hypothetical protein